MAKRIRSAVTLTLSEDEFSAINGFLHEVYQMDPHELTKLMMDNNIIMPINHSETLTKMWGDLHS